MYNITIDDMANNIYLIFLFFITSKNKIYIKNEANWKKLNQYSNNGLKHIPTKEKVIFFNKDFLNNNCNKRKVEVEVKK